MLFPSSSIQSIPPDKPPSNSSPFPPLGASRVHQGRLSLQCPLAPKCGFRTGVGLVCEENLGSRPARLLRQECIPRDEGLPLGSISLEQTFLGPFQDNCHSNEMPNSHDPAHYRWVYLSYLLAHNTRVANRLGACQTKSQLHRFLTEPGCLKYA